jgi:hypothetical protein
MQNIKFIDNQWVTRYVVQMWFKFFGNNFHVAGTKTDLDSLQWDLRKLAQARFQRYEKWRKPPRVWSLFLVKRERITAASSESVSTQFLQPITARIGDYAYQYSQYGISSTLGYTIPVPVTLIFFWPETSSGIEGECWADWMKKVQRVSEMSQKMCIFATEYCRNIYAKHWW